MSRTFKIIVPKPASSNEKGTDIRLYKANEIVNSEGQWQDDVMDTFIKNGWAMEVKVDAKAEEGEAVRARDDKGHYIADDPSTPDVNEAYVDGKAPAKKKTTKKKTTKKKS